jgi:hypothetical protein
MNTMKRSRGLRKDKDQSMVKKSELLECFISPNENDRNLEAANVVDGLFIIGRGLYAVAAAIRELGAIHATPARESSKGEEDGDRSQ